MADLLIHSMSEFRDIILAGLDAAGARTIVEIGAEFGGMSQLLADHAHAAGGTLTSIDPAPQPAFTDWVAGNHHVRHIAATSLSAFDQLADIDAWIVDGDHNWFTVYHELQAIRAACRRDGKPLLAFLHDVSWPSARRDSYYDPATIPAEYRHEHDYDGGASIGVSPLTPHRGFRGMGQFAFACHEGGPRNGVLTAVEDFVEAQTRDGEELLFAHVPAVFGLGVVFDAGAAWAEALAGIVLPYHDNRLIRTLEENRLRNYLTVLDWQDNAAAG